MTGASDEKPGVAPTIFQPDDYLVPSPILEDGGHQIGRLPQEIPIDVLRELHVPENPVKAIRAKCIDCSGAARQRPASVWPSSARYGRSGWVKIRFGATSQMMPT